MIREIKDKKEWNELVLKNPPKSGGFLGSWEWGEFQASTGKQVRRFAFDDACAQVIEHALPFGNRYWYVPRGGQTSGLLDIAKKLDVLFVRFEPTDEESIPHGVRKTIHVSPSTTLMLDLTQSEDELLVGMHEKTRYNIRLAERKGVRVERSRDVECFWNLLQETARRGKFRTHARNYYEKMLTIPFVELWVAKWEGEMLAAGLWAYFGDTVTYLHGGSSRDHRDVMAPYLLHWKVLQDAQERGLRSYDFWGVSEEKKSSWCGFTRFKKGFGGAVVSYPDTFDLPLCFFWYRIYKIIRRIRRL